ncbi:glycosyltransferase family 87 protein [Saccharothrix sp. ST-888]|uniref:glycosyltransferase family 87 protein n=1 Tax=Saccharothrix sp. ST-888 TaxID=1427391 RepID=UPI0007C79F90|nr:glycosyltransferase family 87 protein [Saccharothrix sp. ST-888]
MVAQAPTPVTQWGMPQAGPFRWTRPATWPREALALAGYWAASRMIMIGMLKSGKAEQAIEVHRTYHGWFQILQSGTFPVGDVTWQYPPGAALAMLAPGLLPFLTYLQAFALLMLLTDAITQAALVRVSLRRNGGVHRGRSTAGAWMWAMALPLMLGLPYGRYDLPVTALAMAALLLLPSRPRMGGALAGIAAMVKVWPALVVLGAPRGRGTRQAWLATCTSAAALLLVMATLFRGAFDFLTAQQGRGVEIESLGGSALQVARELGWPGGVDQHYGSLEFLGPYVHTIARASLLLTALAFGWLLLWRFKARRWSAATPYDAALTAVLLFTVTSRVISPQYLIWLIGLAAVCLTVRGSSQRPVALLLLLATAVTTIDYPLFFDSLIHGGWKGTLVIVGRNGLLLAASVWSAARLWRATVSAEAARQQAPQVRRGPIRVA